MDESEKLNEIEGISIETNPYEEDDELCGEFFCHLDPQEHEEFLRRLVVCTPGTWIRLVDLCEGISDLPEAYVQIRGRLADKVFVSHVEWPGAATDYNQPQYMVLIGNTQSMYFDSQLLSPVDHG